MRPASRRSWVAILALAVVIGVVSLASCQNLDRLRRPYHEPAIAPGAGL